MLAVTVSTLSAATCLHDVVTMSVCPPNVGDKGYCLGHRDHACTTMASGVEIDMVKPTCRHVAALSVDCQ